MSRNADSEYVFIGRIGLLLVLIGFFGSILYFGMVLFATRVPDWLIGVSIAASGLGFVVIGISLGLKREGIGCVPTILMIAMGAFFYVFGMDMRSPAKPVPPIRSLPDSHVLATVSIEPNMIPSRTQGELGMMIQNNSHDTLDLSRIELRVPTSFWKCFVIDFAASETSIVEADQKRSLIDLHGVTLTANETWTTSIPLVGNQPGDCSGAYTIVAPVNIGRSDAQIRGTTQLNLSVVP